MSTLGQSSQQPDTEFSSTEGEVDHALAGQTGVDMELVKTQLLSTHNKMAGLELFL